MNAAADLNNAVNTCHTEGKRLCPVEALVVCDYHGYWCCKPVSP